jgi:hypothetical protein
VVVVASAVDTLAVSSAWPATGAVAEAVDDGTSVVVVVGI